MSILSWNVAGLRAAIKKGGLDFIIENKYDIVCLQEIKVEESQLVDFQKFRDVYPHMFFNSSRARKGYSGTAIWSKEKPIKVQYGLINKELDREGRVIIAEFEHFNLLNVYTPNSKADLSRLNERVNEWDTQFRESISSSSKPFILCGDFNVAHQDVDIHEPLAKGRNTCAGFTPAERMSFQKLLDVGFVDIHRRFCTSEKAFTFWPYTNTKARPLNMGWRIDYFLLSTALINIVKESVILSERMGSDHCPILLLIETSWMK
jgi:exodeoxyribonuclease-3